MVNILQTTLTFFKNIFWIVIKILLRFVPNGPFGNKLVLVQVMAWCQPGHKPLPKPIITQSNVAYMC